MKNENAAPFVGAVSHNPAPVSDVGSTVESEFDGSVEIATSGVTPVFAEYRPLQADEIRLLELRPGDWDSPLEFFLQVASIDALPSFEAISYVWGDASDLQHSVFKDSDGETTRKVTITRNLRDALQHFRALDSTRLLWADALCINQSDLTERGHQVHIMKEIYTRACRVLVWLGLEDEGTRSAVLFLRNVANAAAEQTSWSYLEEADIVQSRKAMVIPEHPPDDAQCLSGARLFERDWFKRIWVAQEICCAKTADAYVGLYRIPFNVLGLGALWLYKWKWNMLCDQQKTYKGLLSIKITMSWWKKLPYKVPNPNLLLHDLAVQSATDPRDYVYGLLGFPVLRDVLVGLPLEYDKSVGEVYTRVAFTMIEQSKCLDVLAWAGKPYCSAERPVDHKLGCPDTASWVPRWDCPRGSYSRYPFSAPYFIRSPTYEIEPKPLRMFHDSPVSMVSVDIPKGILKLTGIFLDRVLYTAPHLRWDYEDGHHCMANPETLVDSWIALSRIHPSVHESKLLSTLLLCITNLHTARDEFTNIEYSGSSPNPLEFMTTILEGYLAKEDIVLVQKSSAERFLEALERYDVAPYRDQFADVGYRIFLMTHGCRVFATSEGFIGIGPGVMMEGDQLVFLYGGKLPFIIRPRDGYHELVGEAMACDPKTEDYVHWDLEKMKATELELH